MPKKIASADEPIAGQPLFPEGYSDPHKKRTLLPWSHARQRLEGAQAYWIGTTRPDGRPHIMPVWGVWIDDVLYFDGSPETRRGKNLAQNPAVTVHLDSQGDGKDVVILEGEAHQVVKPDHDLTVRIAAAYCAKYASEGYEPGPENWDNGGLYAMHPHTAFAWTDFLTNPTRWTF